MCNFFDLAVMNISASSGVFVQDVGFCLRALFGLGSWGFCFSWRGVSLGVCMHMSKKAIILPFVSQFKQPSLMRFWSAQH
jgi:hypothetical protein